MICRHNPAVRAAAATLAALMIAAAVAAPASAASKSWAVTLTGAAEAPGPGDADATGTATVSVDDGTNLLCYTINTGLSGATAAHVHKGAKGAAGPVAVPLQTPLGGASKACAPIDKALATAILADPAGYYINVHSTKFPAGAIRAQLGG